MNDKKINSKENYWQFEKLRVWQESMDWVARVYRKTESFPKHELYGLTSQTRRAASSVPLNIAEGTGRRTDKEKIQFLIQARGSLHETVTCLKLAVRLNYLKEQQIQPLIQQAFKINGQLNALMNSLKTKRNDSK